MKLRNLALGLLVISLGSSTGAYNKINEKHPRQKQGKQAKKTMPGRKSIRQQQAITVRNALIASKAYLQQLRTRHKLNLPADEETKLLTITRNLIYHKAGNEDPATTLKVSDWIKIKKALKKYLKMMYPEKFNSKKRKHKRQAKQNGILIPHRQAKRSIRATIKDYLINSCQITDPQVVYQHWKALKPMINKKLDLASIPANGSGMVVPVSVIANIIAAARQALANQGIKLQPKATKKVIKKQPEDAMKGLKNKRSKQRTTTTRRPRRRSYHSRKAVEMRISLTRAEAIVIKHLKKVLKNAANREFLRKQIMSQVKQEATQKGLVFPRVVDAIIKQEVAKFKTVQEQFTETPKPNSSAKKRINRSFELAILEMRDL